MILVVRTDDRAHAAVKSVCLSSVRVQAVERLDSGYLFHWKVTFLQRISSRMITVNSNSECSPLHASC